MQLPVRRQNSFFKGLVTFYLIFLAIFFAAAPFLTLLLYAETDLSLSLLPQLIGFCLQGAFLLVVFSIYENRSTINSKRNHKFALRTFLSAFVTPCLNSAYHDDDLLPSPAAFAEGLDTIKDGGIEGITAATLKNVAKQNVASMESLTVLAAQVDHAHLQIWASILHECRTIKNSTDDENLTDTVVQLLENIRKFDELIIY